MIKFYIILTAIPIVTVGQSAYNGDYGQSVTLVCSVSANPTETRVYWRRLQNGQMNDLSLQSGKYSGSTVGQPSLTVSGLDLSDEGFYQCFAENSVGTGSSQQTFLDVIGSEYQHGKNHVANLLTFGTVCMEDFPLLIPSYAGNFYVKANF